MMWSVAVSRIKGKTGREERWPSDGSIKTGGLIISYHFSVPKRPNENLNCPLSLSHSRPRRAPKPCALSFMAGLPFKDVHRTRELTQRDLTTRLPCCVRGVYGVLLRRVGKASNPAWCTRSTTPLLNLVTVTGLVFSTPNKLPLCKR